MSDQTIKTSTSFATLGLDKNIIKALQERGYSEATPIQSALIPVLLDGDDILAGAQTGTGKTAGYSLPILHRLHTNQNTSHYPKALIIVPTKELVSQVDEAIQAYGLHLPIRSTPLYGGTNMRTQVKRLKEGVDIIVTTPGRLLEHIHQKTVNLNAVEYLVLDEADTVLDMGFMKEVSQIMGYLPQKRQNIFISATLSGTVKRFADKVLTKPKRIEVDALGTHATLVEQVVYPVKAEKKLELLAYMIGSKNYQQVLVFTRKKETADEVTKELNLFGLKSAAIHGDKSAGERARVLNGFKEAKIRVMVATDIAARGIDIPHLPVVMNFDIPHVIGDYVHRIGRTGRAGRTGIAMTFVAPLEMVALRDVEKFLGMSIPKVMLEEYAPVIEKMQRGGRSTKPQNKKTDGAFGKKKKSSAEASKGKKRKTTKRDAFKKFDESKKNKSGKSTRGKKR